ncbi:MAG: FecR domain-containing protein [Burkholderiaceae bacterium]|nr:FecR domain-containing protein [Burkholderiaceae bacterium]
MTMIRALLFALGLFAAIGPAAAADGRALVVAGRVMIERVAPGAISVTALTAGAEVRSGDLIRTGSDGRTQIRFSDGSIVSLQPGTDFRIDEYRFEQNERRAFFFLMRGALRTLTGAIGKANHDEYRMKTPTATVGVRGTEYVAEQTVCDPRCAPGPRAGLRVAVTQGRIVLLTNGGEIEVGTGQAAAAESADAPPQPAERGPVLPPISSTQPRERPAGGTAGSPTGSTAGGATADTSGSRTAIRGGAESAPASGGTGRAATPAAGAGNATDAIGADAFDPAAGAAAPATKAAPRDSTTSQPATTPSRRGAAKTGNIDATTGDGGATTGGGQDRQVPGGSGVTGEPTGAAGSATEPSSTDTWPRFVTTEAGLPAAWVSPNERRSPGGALLPVVDLLAPGVQQGASESGGTSSGSDGGGSSGGSGSGSDNTGGTGNPPDTGGPVLPDPDPPTAPSPTLGAGTHPIDPQAAPGSGPSLRVLHPWTVLDASQGRVREGSLDLDTEMRLNAFRMPIEGLGKLCDIGWLCRVSQGNARIEEAGHDAWTSWGRWTGGDAHVLAVIPLSLDNNRGLHYLVGVPSTTIPTSGVFGYELVGSTRATLSGGGPTGLFGGRVAVAFSPSGARVGIDANVAFPDAAYRFATPGGIEDPTRSPLATADASRAFRGELAETSGSRAPLDCAAGCRVQVDGGLFGPDAARVGITYRISGSGGSSTISGVGVFGKKTP